MTSKTNQTTEEADTSASVGEPGAPVASRKARSKKGASPKKSVAKAGKTAACDATPNSLPSFKRYSSYRGEKRP